MSHWIPHRLREHGRHWHDLASQAEAIGSSEVRIRIEMAREIGTFMIVAADHQSRPGWIDKLSWWALGILVGVLAMLAVDARAGTLLDVWQRSPTEIEVRFDYDLPWSDRTEVTWGFTRMETTAFAWGSLDDVDRCCSGMYWVTFESGVPQNGWFWVADPDTAMCLWLGPDPEPVAGGPCAPLLPPATIRPYTLLEHASVAAVLNHNDGIEVWDNYDGFTVWNNVRMEGLRFFRVLIDESGDQLFPGVTDSYEWLRLRAQREYLEGGR